MLFLKNIKNLKMYRDFIIFIICVLYVYIGYITSVLLEIKIENVISRYNIRKGWLGFILCVNIIIYPITFIILMYELKREKIAKK